MSNHTKEPWLCDKRTGHTLNPQTASTVQGGVVPAKPAQSYGKTQQETAADAITKVKGGAV